jgi:hypothetical protein
MSPQNPPIASPQSPRHDEQGLLQSNQRLCANPPHQSKRRRPHTEGPTTAPLKILAPYKISPIPEAETPPCNHPTLPPPTLSTSLGPPNHHHIPQRNKLPNHPLPRHHPPPQPQPSHPTTPHLQSSDPLPSSIKKKLTNDEWNTLHKPTKKALKEQRQQKKEQKQPSGTNHLIACSATPHSAQLPTKHTNAQ